MNNLNEWIDMNELTWVNWNEWIEKKELKWRNWNEGIEWKDWSEWIGLSELTWMTWQEGIWINDLKWRNWHEWIETNESTGMFWNGGTREEGIDMKDEGIRKWIDTNELTWMNELTSIDMNELPQKCSKPVILSTVFMWNRALAAFSCTFCRPHLPKVVLDC